MSKGRKSFFPYLFPRPAGSKLVLKRANLLGLWGSKYLQYSNCLRLSGLRALWQCLSSAVWQEGGRGPFMVLAWLCASEAAFTSLLLCPGLKGWLLAHELGDYPSP